MCGVPEPLLLQVRGLQAAYGASQVLFGIDLDVPARGGLAVLGRNGVGKTTLMRALMGELPAQAGSVRFDGEDITDWRPEQRARSGLGCVPQEHAVFARLSVRDNLRMGTLGQAGRPDISRALDLFPKLGARLTQPAGSLSGGERKMLAIGRALLASPRLLLLDEPTEGVWIGVIEEIADRLEQLAREIAVVVVEQHLDLAWRVCRQACVIDKGQVALFGDAAALRDGPALMRHLAP